MSLSDSINAIKEFFLDILGFLLPGLFFIYIILVITKIENANIFFYEESNTFLLIIGAYIIGYILYPLSNWSDYLLQYDNDKVSSSIQASTEFHLCLEVLKKIIPSFADHEIEDLKQEWKVRNLRSLVMSYIPEADKKIYTFKFRAELCRIIVDKTDE